MILIKAIYSASKSFWHGDSEQDVWAPRTGYAAHRSYAVGFTHSNAFGGKSSVKFI